MYEDFYHLEGKPFNLTPDTRFLFRSAGHNRVLSFLRYGILRREGFIVVTGEPGTGKSTLIRALLDEIAEKQDLVVAHLEMTQADATELLSMVAGAFGASYEGLSKVSVLQQLADSLTSEILRGKQPILIVDEVQNLSIEALETLRLLINYQTGNVPLLQGFLVGQGIFAQTLAESKTLEPMRQRIITSCHLTPLNTDETRGYITHRLHVAGWKNDPVFTPEAQRAIYDNTGGVPRLVNTLCDRALLVGYIKELHEISGKHIEDVAKELEGESFAHQTGNTEVSSKQRKANAQVESSPLNLDQAQPDIDILRHHLFEIESRLEAVEKLTSSFRSPKIDGVEQLRKKNKELRAKLDKAQGDKERLEIELAEQKKRAEQIQKALQKEVKYLLSRVMPLRGSV